MSMNSIQRRQIKGEPSVSVWWLCESFFLGLPGNPLLSYMMLWEFFVIVIYLFPQCFVLSCWPTCCWLLSVLALKMYI